MTADMRAHGVGCEMKDEGDDPGGRAFHTKVIECTFVLRFHIYISFLWGRATTGGYSAVMVFTPLPQGT